MASDDEITLTDMQAAFEAAVTQLTGECQYHGPVAHALRRIAHELSLPPLLGIAGEFNAGKSSLVNRLLCHELLPTSCLPSTAWPTVLRFGPTARLVIHFQGRRAEEHPLEALDLFGEHSELKIFEESYIATIRWLSIEYPSPFLRECRILDTPGLSDPDQDERTTIRALAQADAIIWCSSAHDPWHNTEKHFWKKLSARLRRISLFVLTKADLLKSDDRQRKLAWARTQLASEFRSTVLANVGPSAHEYQKPFDSNGTCPTGTMSSVEQAIRDVILPWTDEMRLSRAVRGAARVLTVPGCNSSPIPGVGPSRPSGRSSPG